MLGIALAFSRFNRDDPNAGASFVWVSRIRSARRRCSVAVLLAEVFLHDPTKLIRADGLGDEHMSADLTL